MAQGLTELRDYFRIYNYAHLHMTYEAALHTKDAREELTYLAASSCPFFTNIST
jgi:hypothetical protein